MIYAVIAMDPRLDIAREIGDALAAGDWYTSAIAAGLRGTCHQVLGLISSNY